MKTTCTSPDRYRSERACSGVGSRTCRTTQPERLRKAQDGASLRWRNCCPNGGAQRRPALVHQNGSAQPDDIAPEQSEAQPGHGRYPASSFTGAQKEPRELVRIVGPTDGNCHLRDGRRAALPISKDEDMLDSCRHCPNPALYCSKLLILNAGSGGEGVTMHPMN
jgi:hypothetical protein